VYFAAQRVRLLLFILSLTIVRLVAGAVAPLTEDEAYYRLWSLRPEMGYFDHPPMIAWWIWLGRQVAGDTALGVRLMPILGCAVTTVLTADAARLAGASEPAAVRAGVWLNATILIGLGGLLAVPDAPNTLFWTLAIWCALQARRGPRIWWIGCGVAAGLACLSKYSALFLAPGLFLWLLSDREGRRELASPWPWIAALLACLVFAPNVAWNAGHHWETFGKQFGRVRFTAFAPQHLPELIVEQALLLNPLIAWFLVKACLRPEGRRWLAIAAPLAGYLVAHSLHASVQGQWPAPLYPIAVIAASCAADRAKGAWPTRLRTAAPAVGLGIAALATAFIVAPLDGQLPIRDPAAPLRGWPRFAEAVDRTRRSAGAAWIGTASYGLTSQLAAEISDAPTAEIRERERFAFQPLAATANFDRPGLVVDPAGKGELAALRRCFRDVEALPPLTRGLGRSATDYAAYRVSQPRRDIRRLGC
jgi:4-amino-4-deoxy-L-arabinose transferase-like glycosyltransferase